MDISQFRKEAHALADWMADYLENIEYLPVKSQVKPSEILANLPESPPEEGESFNAIMADIQHIIMPGITHWQHPNFHAYFPANSSPPSILGEMITATLGVQGMLWQTSPAATELEMRVTEWLRQMLNLPDDFTGIIQDTASTATLCALLTAREKATGFSSNTNGLYQFTPLTLYCSSETHSSIEKDARIIGIGSNHIRKIPTDSAFSMNPEALEKAIIRDSDEGKKPFCVVATLGTTSSGAMDPLLAITEICKRYGLWLHVDAAWAGSALILARHHHLIEGLEDADSFVFNAHKWLFTNFDCSLYYVRDSSALTHTLGILPEYLKTREQSTVHNYCDWQIPLGRRFRALKLWMVIRSYGVKGLQEMLRHHLALTDWLEKEIARDDSFELVTRSLSLICFRYHPAHILDEEVLELLNSQLLEALNDSGKLYLTHTRLKGRYVLRFSIGQTYTQKKHIESAWEAIKETALLTLQATEEKKNPFRSRHFD